MCLQNNCQKIKKHLDLAKLMTRDDSHWGAVQLKPNSRLPGMHSKANCSHRDWENMTWIGSLFLLHIMTHISKEKKDSLRTVKLLIYNRAEFFFLLNLVLSNIKGGFMFIKKVKQFSIISTIQRSNIAKVLKHISSSSIRLLVIKLKISIKLQKLKDTFKCYKDEYSYLENCS